VGGLNNCPQTYWTRGESIYNFQANRRKLAYVYLIMDLVEGHLAAFRYLVKNGEILAPSIARRRRRRGNPEHLRHCDEHSNGAVHQY